MHLSMALEMNLLRVATHLVRLYTSLVLLRDRVSIRACIFSGLASMPHWLTINPRNFQEAMLTAHLRGLASYDTP